MNEDDDFIKSLDELSEIILKGRNNKLKQSFYAFSSELNRVMINYHATMIALQILNNKQEDNVRGSKLVRK